MSFRFCNKVGINAMFLSKLRKASMNLSVSLYVSMYPLGLAVEDERMCTRGPNAKSPPPWRTDLAETNQYLSCVSRQPEQLSHVRKIGD